MGNALRVVIVDPNGRSRESLKNTLLTMDTIWLEAECSRYEFFEDVVSQCKPDVGIVSLDENPEEAIDLIEKLRNLPDCSMVAVSRSNDGVLILRSMRAGAKEFLTYPVMDDELISAFERLSNQHSKSGVSTSRGCTCIAITGAGGGVGSTSLSVNLGCALASDEANSVALLDLDMALGDADVFLDTIPDFTIADVANNVSRMDVSLLKKSMTKHSSGLHLLPRPVQLQESDAVGSNELKRILGLLKASFTHVLFDLSKSYSPLDLMCLREADQVLLVTQLDLTCLRNVVRLMMSFDEIEGMKDKTHVIINRVGVNWGKIGLKKAQETIGRDVFWQIPNDYRTMVEVRNTGVSLIEQFPKAGITQSVLGLAAALSGSTDSTSNEKAASASVWRRFLPSSMTSSRRQG